MKLLVNEYKEGKAFRYLSCGWVKEVFYHPIAPSSEVCLLKCKVTPSQRLSSKPYDVWAIAVKDSNDNLGGTIKNCYCTCTAGLYGACNHVAGLLFRVESAVMSGITKPSCTDRLAKWNVPSTKTQVSPGPVSSVVFKKDHYRTLASINRTRQEKNVKGRLTFSPLSAEQELYVQDESKVRKDIMNIVKLHAPKSCFAELMEERKLNVKAKEPTPTSIVERSTDFKIIESLSMYENVQNFTEAFRMTEKDRTIIFNNTIGQSAVQDWHNQRKGRITASKFHSVCTRTVSLQASLTQDPAALVSSLLGYNKVPATAAMKHGCSMEIHAKQCYLSLMKPNHRKLKSEEQGLIVMRGKPFIAASPDLKVSCECCGEGLVEIKCPYSIKESIPSADNLTYLQIVDGTTILKRNSDYFYQVQGQMAVTELGYTDFFVFTIHGHFTERIKFDRDFWTSMFLKLEWFWVNCLAPEILTRKILHQLEERNTLQSTTNTVATSTGFEILSRVEVTPEPTSEDCSKDVIPKQITKAKKLAQKVKKQKLSHVYLCGLCKKEVVEKPTKFSEESIGCDKCPLWYHFTCVGIKEGHKIKCKWYCAKCN